MKGARVSPMPVPLVVLSAALRRGGEPFWGTERRGAVEKRRSRNKKARQSRRINRTR